MENKTIERKTQEESEGKEQRRPWPHLKPMCHILLQWETLARAIKKSMLSDSH